VSDRFHELLHRIYLCEDNEITMLGGDTDRGLYQRTSIVWTPERTVSSQWLRITRLASTEFDIIVWTQLLAKQGNDAVEWLLAIFLSLSFFLLHHARPQPIMDAALPRIIGHGVVVDRWIRQNGQWYLRHRVYQQMSINSTFLPDSAKRLHKPHRHRLILSSPLLKKFTQSYRYT